MSRKIKVVLVGDSHVGKTCICNRAARDAFTDDTASTVGASCLTLPGTTRDILFEIWDTAGQDTYKTLVPIYFHGARVSVLVYDVTVAASLTSLDEWVRIAKASAPDDCQFVVVGNKIDLEAERTVPADLAEERSETLGAAFCLEMSAKEGINVSELFLRIEKMVLTGQTPKDISPAPGRREGEIDLDRTGGQGGTKGCC
jgi:small GTP-binding protein